MAAHAYNLSTLEAEKVNQEFDAILSYIVNLRLALVPT